MHPAASASRLVVAALLAAACTPASHDVSPSAERPTYSFSLDIPTTDLHPGDTVTMRWRATRNGTTTQPPPKVQLCFAIIGPYATAQELKASPQPIPACPLRPAGVVYSSPVVEADPLVDSAPSQDVALPRDLAAGLYNIVQVAAAPGSTTSGAGVIRVAAATSAPAPSSTSAATSASATICGTISDWVIDSPAADGSFTLSSPGRAPIALTIPAGRLGSGIAAGYACVAVLAGTPHPLFDGFDVITSPLYVPEGVFPTTTASPAPKDFVVPQACAYVRPPQVTAEQTDWWIDCGASANRDARGTLSGPLAAQGWTLCVAAVAMAQWQKGNIRLGIAESSLAPGDYPRFSQRLTPTSSCN